VRILLGLDYELFFGRRTGTPERCLLEPTEALLELGRSTDLRACLFVDAGYLIALRRQATSFPRLRRTFEMVAAQLKKAISLGHDVQLHVHPHWEDSRFDGENWVVDPRRYRLQDFNPGDAATIVKEYKNVLVEICDKDVFAFRAGGWCLQPFAELKGALKANGVWLDSTVFPGGHNDNPHHGFDFRRAPSTDAWRFDEDPLVPASEGYFLEVPISPIVTGPGLYWKMALAKVGKKENSRLQRFGDGDAIEHTSSYYFSRLLSRTVGPASVDGVKADYLRRECRASGRASRLFNVMGHPKAMTPFSLDKLRELTAEESIEWVTFREFSSQAPRPVRA
jgi:hypothetical protein